MLCIAYVAKTSSGSAPLEKLNGRGVEKRRLRKGAIMSDKTA